MSDRQKDNVGLFHDYGIHLPTQTVELMDEIDEDSVNATIKNLHMLDSYGPDVVTLFLSTPGGNTIEGLKLYDFIRNMNKTVHIICMGEVASIGTIILQAGDKRAMLPNSHLMIHEGAWEIDGHPLNNKRWIKFYDELHDRCDGIYLEKIREKKPRYKKEKLKETLVFDTVIYPKECVAMGLADCLYEDL